MCVCRRRSSQVLSPPGPGGTPPLGTGGRQGIGGGHIQCLRSRYEGSAPAQLKKNKFLIKLFYSFVPTCGGAGRSRSFLAGALAGADFLGSAPALFFGK